jgi:membrane fusion protein (multidrug efflux system)
VSGVRGIARGLGVGLLLVAASTSTGCREKPKTSTAPLPVTVTAVIQRDVPIYREWIGTTVGYVTAQIRPKVSGYLVAQDYQEGGLVKAGALLFRIDPRQYQNAFDQSKGKLDQAEAQLAQAQSQLGQNLAEVAQAKAAVRQAQGELDKAVAMQVKTQQEVERYTPLVARGSLSQQELDNTIQNNIGNQAMVRAEQANLDKARASVERSEAGVDKARADVSAAEAAIAQAQAGFAEARLNLDWTRVLSPIDGVAGIKNADIGDLVGATTVLTTVAAVDPIYVQFNLTEQQYLRWRESHDPEAARRIPIELILANGQTFAHRGSGEILGLQVDPTTGTIPVRASFPNPGSVLRPGQYAKVRFAVFVAKGALLVPQRAVRDTQGLLQVGVVGPDDRVTIQTVEVGERVGPLWIVTRGLERGQRIIVDGLDKVKAGGRVAPTPVEAEPANAGVPRAGPAPAAPSTPSAAPPGQNPPK